MSTRMHSRTPGRTGRTPAGFSLIELMVGIVVSLIGSLAMLLTFAQFEAQKRRTTAANDRQENGSFAAVELERVIRTAGSGLVQGKNHGLSGCPIVASANGTPLLPIPDALPAPFDAVPRTVRAIPILVRDGGRGPNGSKPDTLSVIAGNPAVRVFQATVQPGTTGSLLTVDNAVGIQAGDGGADYLLGTPNASGNCVLGLLNRSVSSAPPTFSLAAAPSNGFIGTPKVFDLGQNPTLALYGIDTSQTPNVLVRYDLLGGTQASIADGIVMLKAVYGVDDGAAAGLPAGGVADDGVIDEWVSPTGAWDFDQLSSGTSQAAAAVRQIKAVRVALVAQSEIAERLQDYSGPEQMDLFPDLGSSKTTIALSPHFRYKVYDVTIPVRNALVTRYF